MENERTVGISKLGWTGKDIRATRMYVSPSSGDCAQWLDQNLPATVSGRSRFRWQHPKAIENANRHEPVGLNKSANGSRANRADEQNHGRASGAMKLHRRGRAFHYVMPSGSVDMDVHETWDDSLTPGKYLFRAARQDDLPPPAHVGDLAPMDHNYGVGKLFERREGTVGVNGKRLHFGGSIVLESGETWKYVSLLTCLQRKGDTNRKHPCPKNGGGWWLYDNLYKGTGFLSDEDRSATLCSRNSPQSAIIVRAFDGYNASKPLLLPQQQYFSGDNIRLFQPQYAIARRWEW